MRRREKDIEKERERQYQIERLSYPLSSFIGGGGYRPPDDLNPFIEVMHDTSSLAPLLSSHRDGGHDG